MNENYSEDIKEIAKKDTYAKEISVFLTNLFLKDAQQAFLLAKKLFFASETHPNVRYAIAPKLSETNNQQLFNQLLSYFILKNFPDKRALICALKGFANPMAVTSLIQYYKMDASFAECLEILDALAFMQAPETIEFLSQVYNDQIAYINVFNPQEKSQIREKASSALSRKLMRFD